MAFWDSLWLNESFATLVAAHVVDALEPSFDFETNDFVASEMQMAFELDGMLSSHPVEVEVKRSEEIDQVSDEGS